MGLFNLKFIIFTFREHCRYRLEIDNEILAEDAYESLSAAKKGLAESAIANLRKSCFTIFRVNRILAGIVSELLQL